jgi:putative CocE/NonD family hydrolase
MVKIGSTGWVAGLGAWVAGLGAWVSATLVSTGPAIGEDGGTVAGGAEPARSVSLLPPSGERDADTFRFYLNEEVLVTTRYEWGADGSYRSDYTLAMAGQIVETTLGIAVSEGGRWTRMDMGTPRGPVEIVREDTLARITHENDVSTVVLKPRTVVFENFSPALMAAALRAYDEAAGGKQTIPIFIVPAVVMDGSLERLDVVERTIAGRDLELRRYRLGLPGVDVTLYIDPAGRVVFGDVPQQHGAYVREGFETLMRAEVDDPLLSKPEYDVIVDDEVGVPMRDGLALATDIYRPGADGRFPVILVRTPYKKEMNELQARFYARRGYVYAVQDCRGRFASPGEWRPFFDEPKDGYDTIEWLADQPWSTGKVGMIGGSYLGWVQWWAARDHPPHLATMIPNVAPPDPYYNIPYEYGVFFILGAIWWADVLESEATGDLSGKAFMEIGEKKYAKILRDLPVIDLDEKVLGRRNPYWREWISHPDNDEYWEPASFLDHLDGLDIPVFHQSGWFDGDGIGSKLNYLKMASHGHRYQKLVLGPWGHTDTATRRIADRDFGEAAIIDLQRDYLRWFDHWLKGVANGIDTEPLVSIFVMGSNEWLHGDRYPLAETKMTPYYLASGGHANTSTGDGSLATARPDADAPPDRYVYDPLDPTPYPAFYVDPKDLEEDEADSAAADTVSVETERAKHRAYYAMIDSTRADILVYDTAPLTESLTIAGPISATLYASTTARDTDWFMRLSEVAADGEIFPLAEGKIRARYRESFRKPRLLKPGEVLEYRLDLWQTGITIPEGARLRVEVASASFPMFSRNLNTGGHNETETEHVPAEQTIYHDAARPSHVLLPVIPRATGAAGAP